MSSALKRLCPVGFPATLYDPAAPQAQLLLALVRHHPEKLPGALAELPGAPLRLHDVRTGYWADVPLMLLTAPKGPSWSLKNFPLLQAWEAAAPLDWQSLRATSAAGEIGAAGLVACLLAQSVALCRRQAKLHEDQALFSEEGEVIKGRAPPPVRTAEGFSDWAKRLDWAQPGPMGRTALHWLLAEAPWDGMLQVAQLLTEAGVDWQLRDEHGDAAAALLRRRAVPGEEQELAEAVALQVEGLALEALVQPGQERPRSRI